MSFFIFHNLLKLILKDEFVFGWQTVEYFLKLMWNYLSGEFDTRLLGSKKSGYLAGILGMSERQKFLDWMVALEVGFVVEENIVERHESKPMLYFY